jgi:hypothetical protein
MALPKEKFDHLFHHIPESDEPWSIETFFQLMKEKFSLLIFMQFKRMAPIFLQVYNRFASVKFRGSLNGSIFKVNVEFHSIKFKNSLISLKGVACPFLLDIFTSKFAQVELY